MTRQPFTRLLVPILILLLGLNFGCGTAKTVVHTTTAVIQKIKPEKPSLIKKIMVFPPIDLSGLPAGKASQATADFVEILKQSPRLSIYPPPEGWSLPMEIKKPEFGVAYYNPKIAEMAKDRNMNALMAAFLPPIETSKGRAGAWPFRYDTDVYKLSIVINVMDARTGCLFLTDFSSKEVLFPSDEIGGLTKEEILEEIMIQAMPDILERQASLVMKELETEPWTGQILDEKDGLFMINAGKDAGVVQDQVFTVYAPGETIACKTGRSVALLGDKIGQIKITSVMEDRAMAAPVMEDHALADTKMEDHALADPEDKGNFSVGQTIVFNPDPDS